MKEKRFEKLWKEFVKSEYDLEIEEPKEDYKPLTKQTEFEYCKKFYEWIIKNGSK